MYESFIDDLVNQIVAGGEKRDDVVEGLTRKLIRDGIMATDDFNMRAVPDGMDAVAVKMIVDYCTNLTNLVKSQESNGRFMEILKSETDNILTMLFNRISAIEMAIFSLGASPRQMEELRDAKVEAMKTRSQDAIVKYEETISHTLVLLLLSKKFGVSFQ